MTPQPMSDAEIRRLSDEADIAWGKAVGGPLPYELFARAILAARDAQWLAMLGEPVAWRLSGNGHEQPTGPQFWRRPPNSLEITSWARLGIPATVTPLYAIKETP